MKENSLFVLWPYVGFALFLAGTIFRYILLRRQPSALAAEINEAKTIFDGRVWRISLLVLLLGHLAGLLMPGGVLMWNNSLVRLYLHEGLLFVAGLAAIGSAAILIWRQMGRSTGSVLQEIFDTTFLALIFVALLSGLALAIFYRWGSSWGAMTLTPYVRSLFGGHPAIQFAAQMPFIVRLHVLVSFAAVAIIPLTRVSVFPVAILRGFFVVLGWPFSTAANILESWLRKRNFSARFWPEED